MSQSVFYLRERHDDSESHATRIIHFYVGDDDDEPRKERRSTEVESQTPKVGRLGEGRDDVAIIVDSTVELM